MTLKRLGEQRLLEVGILSSKEIVFEIISSSDGPRKVICEDGKIKYDGVLREELSFDAPSSSVSFSEPFFILHDVVIGKEFHWERKQNQVFAGSLKFIVEGDCITAINVVGIEDYLLSVISSEMRPEASLEFLKAHAIISRSWVMSQIERHCSSSLSANGGAVSSVSDFEIIRWWDHDDHKNFDVCADDHCQRYQGLSSAVGQIARLAVGETWGKVLTYEGRICDARFSKCCGGRTERFSAAWEDRDYPYLSPVDDSMGGDVFCDTSDERILSQVLNDYDLETKDFFRWREEYDIDEFSSIVREKTHIDFGRIEALIPVETGASGRIVRLRIKGGKCERIIGKELFIRRALSPTHLKSSAFKAAFVGDRLILEGTGWGHGVGLCQIGAAVMATKGFSHEEILKHYYPGSEITVI